MRTTSRLVAVAAGSTLVLSGLTAPTYAAPGDPAPADAAVSWLLANGVHTGANLGLAGDTALAMAEIDATGYAEQIDAIWARLEADVKDTTPGSSVAKSAVVAQAAGADASAVITLLEGKVDDTTGALTDVTDYDGVIAQGLAARALSTAASPEGVTATAHLLAQQCESGGFAAKLGADCNDPTTSLDVDATALAVISLAAIGEAAAAEKGRTWLRGQQEPSGAWSTWGTPNSNTTGVAAWALGESPEAVQAAAWLRGLQMVDAPGCDVYRPVGDAADPQGGVVYSADDLATAATAGVSDREVFSIAYATPQAAPALRWAPAATGDVTAAGTSGYVKAGTRTGLTVGNVAVNDRFCVTGVGEPVAGTAAGSSTVVPLALPTITGTYTARVQDTQGRTATHRYRVLGSARFAIARKARVRRTTKQTIRVRGLAAGERVTVFFRGKRIRRGTASAAGVYRTSFKVGRRVGKAKVVVKGQFADIRKGSTTFRVVR